MKLTSYAVAVCLAAVAVSASAADTFYDLGENGENKVNISWESKATVETMIGRTVKCKGLVILSAEKPETSYLKISVPVETIETGIPLRDEHMRSPDWLDAKNHPTIDFESTSVKAVAGAENTYDVTGKLTVKGVTKEYTIRGKATPRKALDKAYEKFGYKGDMVQLEASWTVKLADHGVKVPDALAVKVADTVKISLDVFGFTNDKPTRDADPRAKKG